MTDPDAPQPPAGPDARAAAGANPGLEPRAAELVQTIDAAFGAAEYPGDDEIVPAGYARDTEARRVQRLLRGWHWRDLPFDRVGLLASSLSLLTPPAYRFYLPACLVFSVVDFERADVLSDNVVSSLTEPRESDVDDLRAAVGAAGLAETLGAAQTERLVEAQSRFHSSGAALDAFITRVEGFDEPQRAAIRSYLEYLRDELGDQFSGGEPGVALDRFWAEVG